VNGTGAETIDIFLVEPSPVTMDMAIGVNGLTVVNCHFVDGREDRRE